jgi:hypothetical protein
VVELQRAEAALGFAAWRICGELGMGLPGGAIAAFVRAVPWDGDTAGSAVMILIGGIDEDEGKYKLLTDFGPASGVASAAARGELLAAGRLLPAGQPAE